MYATRSIKRDQVWQRQKYLAAKAAGVQLDSHAPTVLREFQEYVQILNSVTTHDPAEGDTEVKPTASKLRRANDILKNNNIQRRSNVAVALGDWHVALATHLERVDAKWLANFHRAFASVFETYIYPVTPESYFDLNYAVIKEQPNAFSEVNALLLKGLVLEARAFFEQHQGYFSTEEKPLLRARLLAAATHDLSAFRNFKLPELNVEFALWALAVEDRSWRQDMRAIKSFGKSSEPVVGLIELLTLKTKDDFRAKYSSIGDRLSELLKHGDPHQISLCFAAATRFFLRAKCQPLASYCLATYRHICLQSSGQTTNDSFGFFSEKLPTYKLPSSIAPLSRAIEYGGLTYDLVKYFGRERFRTLLTSSERQRRLKDADQEALYGIICGYLSQFKGPVLKFGQIFGSFTSDEATSKFFGALTDRNTPMDFATVSNVVQNAYGTRLNSVFREFNEQPLGVGSIGQVHQARLMNGSTVAVKVKFPKIEEAIKFDLFILRQLSPLMRVMRPNLCYNAILKEVELQFLGECNFEEEARRQHLLRCSYGGDLKIPEAFMGLSRRSVLVSELVGGRDFFSFLSESSQAERDRAGAAIVRFVVSCCRDGFFNSDPNTGNFKFTDQGVYALDFGGSKLWGDAHRRLWSDIIVAGIDKDRQLFQKTIKEMGIPGSMARFDYDAAYQQMIETGIMGYIAEDCVRSIPLELVLNDIKKMTLPDRLSGKYRNIPADFVMGFRIYFGHVALVAKLGARANWSNIVRSVMSEQLLPKGTRCKSYGMF